MKPLLLLLVIHVLILHQYQKDKNETLAPRKSNAIKATVHSPKQEGLRSTGTTSADSLIFSYQHVTTPHLSDSVMTGFISER